MTVKLLTEPHLRFLSLKGGCTGSSKSTLVKISHCWKSHVMAQLSYTLDGSLASFQNKRKIPSDPQERIKPITNSNPRHPDSPFYGPNPIKPLATLTLTKIKEVCGGDEGSQSIDDVAPSTEDLVNQMKKKMMLTKKLGTVLFVCLFDLILYVPSTIFQLNGDRSSWVEPVLS